MSLRAFTAAEFLPAQPPQALGKDEIHLWFCPRWEGVPRAVAESPYVRALLANYLDCAPGDLHMVRDGHGKPRLANATLEFNVSHSGGAVLIGVSRNRPLGVDLELPRRSRPVLDLARRYFHADEVAALTALPQAGRQDAFLRLWSCKEALLKAQGSGIAFGLHRIVFALNAAGAVTGLQAIDGELAADWFIRPVSPVAEAAAAVAWRGTECTIRTFQASAIPA